jgi:hypothetical protein
MDLLRGIGQWMVYLHYIPANFVNWFTLCKFSDVVGFFRVHFRLFDWLWLWARNPELSLRCCYQAALDARLAALHALIFLFLVPAGNQFVSFFAPDEAR